MNVEDLVSRPGCLTVERVELVVGSCVTSSPVERFTRFGPQFSGTCRWFDVFEIWNRPRNNRDPALEDVESFHLYTLEHVYMLTEIDEDECSKA